MTGSPAPRATRAGVAASHAQIAHRRRRAAVSTALRTRSVHAREVLAELAWPGRTPAELDAWALDHAGTGRLPQGSTPLELADYARVVALQLGTDRDRAVGRSLLDNLAAGPGWKDVLREHVELLAHLRILAGDPGGAVAAVEDPRARRDVADAVRADALHPRIATTEDATGWAEAFTTALHGPALSPFLPPPAGAVPSLDELRTEPRPTVVRPERVTVLMSAYRPGPPLLTAVRSVLAQTWTNLELFVVDDASGDDPAWARALDVVAGLDERVTVVRKAVNGGTYRARNTALRLATGDFVVVLDSDDWWHPQTLELCAGPLVERPQLLATRAEGVRVTPDLLLTRPGYRPRFASAATVLFRRLPVMDRIGFFDTTRKGADTEYARRLEASCGPVVHDIPETTTLLRSGEDTLSSDEFGMGWRHPARHQYKSTYGVWHEQIRTGAATPYLDPDQPRAFPEPLRWSRPTHPVLGTDRHLHLCLASDWRRFGGPQRSMVEEIRAARAAGLRVGVMHLEAYRFMGNKDVPATPELLELLAAGDVTWVHPDDDVDIDVLMVRYPPILQYPPTLPRHVRASTVLVMANQAPLERDGSDQRYVVRDVTERAEELFGAPVRWVPQSPEIRRILLEQDPEVPLTDWDNPGLIVPEEWASARTRRPGEGGRPVVVGRHSRDDRIKFPSSWQELVRGYDFGPGYEVRMLGAAVTTARLRAEAGDGAAPVPAGWTVLEHGSRAVTTFLHDLDFYVYLDNADSHESFGRTLLEAAASGVLVVAHPKHRPTFGDALDYAAPGEAQELVARYVADPDAYTDRVSRTLAAVHERYSRASFAARINELVPASGPSRPVAAPERLTLRPGRADLGGAPRREDVADGAQVLQVPLRSAADAARADGVTVLHGGVPDPVLGDWLGPVLEGWRSPTWSPGELLTTAPDGVAAVVLRREGTASALGRGRWTGLPGGAGSDHVPHVPPAGWDQTSWSDLRAPRQIHLRPMEIPS